MQQQSYKKYQLEVVTQAFTAIRTTETICTNTR